MGSDRKEKRPVNAMMLKIGEQWDGNEWTFWKCKSGKYQNSTQSRK